MKNWAQDLCFPTFLWNLFYRGFHNYVNESRARGCYGGEGGIFGIAHYGISQVAASSADVILV